jgi:hypothetical protein
VTISVYVAARWENKPEAMKLRDALAKHGIGCTSRWLEEEPSLTSVPAKPDSEKRRIAEVDVYDVRRAQALVLFNQQEKAKQGTGGCHVEFGIALGTGMPVFLVGYSTEDYLPECLLNIFHYLPQVRCFSWPAHVAALVEAIREACPDFGATWDSPKERAAWPGASCK